MSSARYILIRPCPLACRTHPQQRRQPRRLNRSRANKAADAREQRAAGRTWTSSITSHCAGEALPIQRQGGGWGVDTSFHNFTLRILCYTLKKKKKKSSYLKCSCRAQNWQTWLQLFPKALKALTAWLDKEIKRLVMETSARTTCSGSMFFWSVQMKLAPALILMSSVRQEWSEDSSCWSPHWCCWEPQGSREHSICRWPTTWRFACSPPYLSY